MSDGNCRINLPISILHEEAQVQLPTFFAAVLFNNSVPLDGPPFVGHIWIHFPAAKQNVDKCVWLHFPANMVRWDWLLDCQNFLSARAIIRFRNTASCPGYLASCTSSTWWGSRWRNQSEKSCVWFADSVVFLVHGVFAWSKEEFSWAPCCRVSAPSALCRLVRVTSHHPSTEIECRSSRSNWAENNSGDHEEQSGLPQIQPRNGAVVVVVLGTPGPRSCGIRCWQLPITISL